MELQEEEKEVILSIYECDPAFHQLSAVTFQYKFGEEGDPKSFLIEISWGKDYPNEVPVINMNTFYNDHINNTSKAKVCNFVLEEAEKLIGTPMTYSIIELVKENYLDLIDESDSGDPEENDDNEDDEDEDEEDDDDEDEEDDEYDESIEEESDDEETGDSVRGEKKKKEHLTKAQKRKMWNRLNCHGERPRGWNWIDVIHHLSQTGPKITKAEERVEGT